MRPSTVRKILIGSWIAILVGSAALLCVVVFMVDDPQAPTGPVERLSLILTPMTYIMAVSAPLPLLALRFRREERKRAGLRKSETVGKYATIPDRAVRWWAGVGVVYGIWHLTLTWKSLGFFLLAFLFSLPSPFMLFKAMLLASPAINCFVMLIASILILQGRRRWLTILLGTNLFVVLWVFTLQIIPLKDKLPSTWTGLLNDLLGRLFTRPLLDAVLSVLFAVSLAGYLFLHGRKRVDSPERCDA